MNSSETQRSRPGLDQWLEESAKVLDRTEAARAFVDRLFPEPEPGDNRRLFSADIDEEIEFSQRDLDLPPEVISRINGSCVIDDSMRLLDGIPPDLSNEVLAIPEVALRHQRVASSLRLCLYSPALGAEYDGGRINILLL